MQLPRLLLPAILAILLLVSLSDAKRVSRPSLLPRNIKYSYTPKPGLKDFLGLSRRSQSNPEHLVARHTECRNVHKSADKCRFIRENCEDERVGIFDYLELYYCRLGSFHGIAFVIITSWLAFLFTTLGIAASDFFCVNLSTIASVLGMSESMAGVTFLAFGNGSPDVFSTFAAMKIDSGSLAVGELIGAACFITAVVAGSMAIVRPFKVGRKSFVRDVSFFTVSICFGLFFLLDGRIQMWECVVMILFYLCYVTFVIGWHWMAGRRKIKRRKERHAREHYTAPEEEVMLLEDEDDEDGGVNAGPETGTLGGFPPDFGELERGQTADDEEEEDEEEVGQREYAELSNNMRITRPGTERRLTGPPHSIRPSLVGALEFRAVLNSLEKTKNLQGRQIHLRRYSDDPAYPLSGPARDSRHTPHSLLMPAGGPSGRTRAVSVNDITAATASFRAQHVPELLVLESEDERTPAQSGRNTPSNLLVDPVQFLTIPFSNGASLAHSPPGTAPPSPRSLPRLVISESEPPSVAVSEYNSPAWEPPSPLLLNTPSLPTIRLPRPSIDSLTIVSPVSPKWRLFRYWPYKYAPSPQILYDTFFPTLSGYAEKSLLEKAFALFAAPSVFFLALTLPVVEGSDMPLPPEPKWPSSAASINTPGSPRSFVSTTTTAPPTPMMPALGLGTPGKDWNRWLVAVQCIASPVFIVIVLFGESDSLRKPILYALVVGLVCLGFLLTFTSPTQPPRLHYLLCFAGFVVAISWISTIAGEVVGILKAIGIIFGISDAILGLTIFAVGNSLGDLVADITVARLGFPVMALSACFGGPMLNILLGIGVSGLYMTLLSGDPVYRIEVSSTLVISAATLLVTLVVLLVWVPLNDWWMSRRIGWTLIAIWVVSTAVNVVVEVMGMGTKWGGEDR